MKLIRDSYNKYSKVYNLIFLGISISITLGIILSFSLDEVIINNMFDYFIEHITNYNSYTFSNIIYPIIIYIVIFLCSLTIIGVFIPFLAIFIENISIGLILGILLKKSMLKGFLFGIIYFIITKLLYLIILLYITINLYKFVKTLILSLKNKNNESIYSLYSKILLRIIFSILAITVYNLLNIFIAPKLIKLFIFLI
ncbi:MAG: hypothetical protein IJD92_04295 [Bacilli bacterium]|nr:hypothetical protein [Bacilli bacterium]